MYKQLSCLLILLVFSTSCNGQVRSNLPVRSSKAPQTSRIGNSKIVRTQGAGSAVVRCELVDRDGNIWFSIDGEGAYRYDGKSFTNFTVNDGLCDNRISGIVQDKAGNLLFGTGKGICGYDGKTFAPYAGTDTLSITCLLLDRDGALWFGAQGEGIYRYDGKTLANFLHGNDHSYNLGNNSQLILDVLQDRAGNMWFSSWNGGGVWQYDGKTFRNYLPAAGYYRANQDKRGLAGPKPSAGYLRPASAAYVPTPDYITDDMIFSISEDKKGNLWLGTRDHGACRYDGKSFMSFGKAEGMQSRDVYQVLEDRKGNFWFTTEKDGVWRYDGSSLVNFTEKDGLVNNAVLSILEDHAGNIWFGTKWFGLSRYDGKSFTTYSSYK